MATGNKTYDGLAVPINGEFNITQATGATDIATITRASGGTGDFFVLRDAGGTEYFVVKSDGSVDFTAGAKLNLGSALSTAPTTGLSKGELFLIWSANSVPTLACVTSTAANTVKYISPFDTETLGRTT